MSRTDDSAALALHEAHPLALYVDIVLARTGEVIPQHVWDAMNMPGSREVHAAGFIPPLAGNMLFGRIIRRYTTAATEKYKAQTVVVVEGMAIMYNGDVQHYKRTKTDPKPRAGEDVRTFMRKNYSAYNGIFNAALMATLEALSEAAIGSAVKIIYGDYEPISDQRCRKEATCEVWDGELANKVLAPFGV